MGMVYARRGGQPEPPLPDWGLQKVLPYHPFLVGGFIKFPKS